MGFQSSDSVASVVYIILDIFVGIWEHCARDGTLQKAPPFQVSFCFDIHFWLDEKKNSILRALIYPDVSHIAPETVEPWLLEEESVITVATQCDTLSGSLAIKCSRLIVLRPEEACPSQAFILLPETKQELAVG